MINKKPYKIYGRARIINGEYVDLWFKTYNKQQAINFIKNHSEYYDILNLKTYIHIAICMAESMVIRSVKINYERYSPSSCRSS